MTAKDETYGWALRQETRKDDIRAWFTIDPQPDGRVALLTCHERFVIAPQTSSTRVDWLLRQDPEPGDCGLFTVIYLGDDRIAFITCAGRYWTAGDWGWEGSLQWALVGETPVLLEWEEFKLEPP